MSAYVQQVAPFVEQLNALRDTVAAAARLESDATSHKAYVLQAGTLRNILGQVSGLLGFAQAIQRRLGEEDEDSVTGRYLELLADYLTAHVAETASTLGDDGVEGLFARRHFDMIGEFCRVNADTFYEMAGALQPASSPAPS